MKTLLIYALLMIFPAGALGQGSILSKTEFDAVMDIAAAKAVVRNAGPYREVVLMNSVFEGAGAIFSESVVTEFDGKRNSHSRTEGRAGPNVTLRDEIEVGGMKYQRVNRGQWTVSASPSPPVLANRKYANPYPPSARYVEHETETPDKRGFRNIEVVYTESVRQPGTSVDYAQEWNIQFTIDNSGEIIRISQVIRASGPLKPTKTTIITTWHRIPVLKIVPPV
jgi:hypothetical protein